MHQGSASEHTVNPAYRPSPSVESSHFLSCSPPPSHHTLPSGTESPLRSLPPSSFLPLHTKTWWRGPFSSTVTPGNWGLGNFPSTHTHTHSHIHGHLKFKGRRLPSAASVLPNTTTCPSSLASVPLSFLYSLFSLSRSFKTLLENLAFLKWDCFLLDCSSMQCVWVFTDECSLSN